MSLHLENDKVIYSRRIAYYDKQNPSTLIHDQMLASAELKDVAEVLLRMREANAHSDEEIDKYVQWEENRDLYDVAKISWQLLNFFATNPKAMHIPEQNIAQAINAKIEELRQSKSKSETE
jgi:hypothetical protein